jgi:hypothetical protein
MLGHIDVARSDGDLTQGRRDGQPFSPVAQTVSSGRAATIIPRRKRRRLVCFADYVTAPERAQAFCLFGNFFRVQATGLAADRLKPDFD